MGGGGGEHALCKPNNHFVLFTAFEPMVKIWYRSKGGEGS